MRISDWSSDVCSSDLFPGLEQPGGAGPPPEYLTLRGRAPRQPTLDRRAPAPCPAACAGAPTRGAAAGRADGAARRRVARGRREIGRAPSELQSLMRISYAVFCFNKT